MLKQLHDNETKTATGMITISQSLSSLDLT